MNTKSKHFFRILMSLLSLLSFMTVICHTSSVISAEINEEGALAAGSAYHQDEREEPFAYRGPGTEAMEVVGGFSARQENPKLLAGHEPSTHDREPALIADPSLKYSTYLGGSSWDMGEAIAVDPSGAVYLAGWTESADFPLRNPIQRAYEGKEFVYYTDGFVSKLNGAGDSMIYSTFLGGRVYRHGNAADFVKAIAADKDGNAYIVGYTNSIDFPTRNPIQSALAGGTDGFVAKLNATGELVYSTYLGGKGNDYVNGVAVDSAGAVYVTGSTMSADFPSTRAFQKRLGGETDAFVTKIDASGATIIYSTYLGGERNDYGNGVVVDESGRTHVTGYTSSLRFPVANPIQEKLKGGDDSFVARFTPQGEALEYSTYIGGNEDDQAHGIAIDAQGNVYITGATLSTDFPVKNPVQSRNFGGFDVFVMKISKIGNTIDYSTYFGGDSNDKGWSIAVDGAGAVYITGDTESADFPARHYIQKRKSGLCDAFVSKIDSSGSTLCYSTYLGGDMADYGRGIAVDAAGGAYITGWTESPTFPTKNGLYKSKCKECDIFFAKIGQ